MLRKDIETMLKTAKQKTISLVLRKEDPLGMACSLQGGYLMDCWGHRIDRKLDIWGYIEYDGKGNADRVCFATGERIPCMRDRYPVNNQED